MSDWKKLDNREHSTPESDAAYRVFLEGQKEKHCAIFGQKDVFDAWKVSEERILNLSNGDTATKDVVEDAIINAYKTHGLNWKEMAKAAIAAMGGVGSDAGQGLQNSDAGLSTSTSPAQSSEICPNCLMDLAKPRSCCPPKAVSLEKCGRGYAESMGLTRWDEFTILHKEHFKRVCRAVLDVAGVPNVD